MTFTKEQLIAAAHGRIDFANMMLSDNPEPLKERTWSIELELARIALSALRERAEPVAVLDIQSGRQDGNKFALVFTRAAHTLPDDVYNLYTAPPAPVEHEDDSEIKWRELALQFDGHRMQAICFLKQILNELPEAEFSSARDFLKAGPLPGEEVLRNRIAALAPPAPVVPDALEQFAEFMAAESIKAGDYPDGWQCKAANAAHDYAQAGRAAPTAPVVPEGWKLVPIEPTQEMIDAHVDGVQSGGMQKGYRAMLAAAPGKEG